MSSSSHWVRLGDDAVTAPMRVAALPWRLSPAILTPLLHAGCAWMVMASM